jgi:hypothetical protein
MKDRSTNSEFAKQTAVTPLIQQYYPQAAENVYTLSGFREATGGGVIMRAARKILQQPRSMGIGLCFEPALVDPLLAERTSLCASALDIMVSSSRNSFLPRERRC